MPWVNQVLSSPAVLGEIAARSYTHENGFDKIVLVDSQSPSFQLRLHIWWPVSGDINQSHIHAHSADFLTRIVNGSYLMELFGERSDGQPFHRYSYRFPDGTSDRFRFDVRPAISLVLLKQLTFRAGTGYFLDHRSWHRIHPTQSTILSSIVLQGQTRINGADVFTEAPLAESPPPPHFFSASDLRGRLLRYRQHLNDRTRH